MIFDFFLINCLITITFILTLQHAYADEVFADIFNIIHVYYLFIYFNALRWNIQEHMSVKNKNEQNVRKAEGNAQTFNT